MRESLTLLFLIVAYNFLLWNITRSGLSPIPLFPEDPYHTVLTLSYNSVLYVSWLFGERQRAVQWIGYLFFFQIVALSIYFEDLSIVVRDLPPVIFTFALVALFESPTEKRIREVEREREELLREIDRVTRERERVEIHLRMLKSEIEKVEREKRRAELSQEVSKELEGKLKDLERELNEYKEKESRLLEANRKLFQLLEVLRTDTEIGGGHRELANLRKERKKLIKELVQLQELVDIYAGENEKLKEENKILKEELENLRVEIDKMEISLEERKTLDVKDICKEILSSLLQLDFSERSVEELLRMPKDRRKLFLKELLKFSFREDRGNVQPLTTLRNVYKLRLSGGRIYLRKLDGKWEVVGLLDSEKDKDKERYIRNVLSKIV